jgi:hypothetical protein
MNADVAFLEQTLFMIFLWLGIWGNTELILAHATVSSKALMYAAFIIISLVFLYLRGHTTKLACV